MPVQTWSTNWVVRWRRASLTRHPRDFGLTNDHLCLPAVLSLYKCKALFQLIPVATSLLPVGSSNLAHQLERRETALYNLGSTTCLPTAHRHMTTCPSTKVYLPESPKYSVATEWLYHFPFQANAAQTQLILTVKCSMLIAGWALTLNWTHWRFYLPRSPPLLLLYMTYH